MKHIFKVVFVIMVGVFAYSLYELIDTKIYENEVWEAVEEIQAHESNSLHSYGSIDEQIASAYQQAERNKLEREYNHLVVVLIVEIVIAVAALILGIVFTCKYNKLKNRIDAGGITEGQKERMKNHKIVSIICYVVLAITLICIFA